jgi:hypothetical protein
MAIFLHGNEINLALEDIISNADKELVIISPYIKLHGRIKDLFQDLKKLPEVSIIIAYGKNDGENYKSLGKDDFLFLREFPNIEIKYEQRLHAKYYANEFSSLLTSMNLHEYSQNNNIEFGIITESSSRLQDLASRIMGKDDIDMSANHYFRDVLGRAKTVFKRTAHFDGLIKKSYKESITEIDELSAYYENKEKENRSQRKEIKDDHKTGYCIRTGVPIPLDQKMPLSKEAFKNWSKHSNLAFPEKFDHFTGENSNKQTSFERPVLRKNWSEFQAALKNK